MRFLVLACVLGFVAADLAQEAAVDKAVLSFFQGASKAGSLSEALGVHEKWLDDAGDDIQTELGKQLRESLNEILQKIKDHIDHHKEVGNDLLEKLKEMRQKIADAKVDVGNKAKELLEKIKDKAKDYMKSLLEKIGLGKRAMNSQIDVVARSSFKDFLEIVKQRVLDNVHKIREYIRNIESDSPLARKLKEFVEKLEDADLKEIIRGLFDHKPGHAVMRGETWDKIKNFFKDLHIKIQDHSRKFGEWVKDMWGQGAEKLKEKYGSIKAIAIEFVSHAKDIHAEVAREALEFFRPYKDDLGVLWQQIVDSAKEIIGRES